MARARKMTESTPLPSISPIAFTEIDAVLLAKTLMQHRVVDRERFTRAVDIVQRHATTGGISYSIEPRGNHFATQRCHYMVSKFDKTGKEMESYFINLSNPLACSCPDVQHNGVINCKHIYAVQIWQMAQDLMVAYRRSL